MECGGEAGDCTGYLDCHGALDFPLPIGGGTCFESCSPSGSGYTSCCTPGHFCGTLADLLGLQNKVICCIPGATYEGVGFPIPLPSICDATVNDYFCHADADCPMGWGLNACKSPPSGKRGVCVPCLSDSHCAGSDVCLDEVCVECRGDSDCTTPGLGVCDQNRCVECKTDVHCGSPEPFCISRICRECRDDYDCSGNTVCHASRGCVECVESADCPPSLPRCSGNRCYECVYDSDCGEGERCEEKVCNTCTACLGMCDDCTADSECPSGTKCRRSGSSSPLRCRPACSSSGTCSSTAPLSGNCGSYTSSDGKNYCACSTAP